MTIIRSGDIFDLYDNSIKTYDKLPAGAYTVEFDHRKGCYLMEHSHIEITEKVYGVQNEKMEKVMNTFSRIERSLGVILSGDKGIGKTMFAKMLCVKAIEKGMPVILVENCYDGIVRLIEKIDQECLVLFDEFEKNFVEKDRSDYEDEEEDEAGDQSKLLSLFDGTSGGKKLFVVTCNDIFKLNDCLLNRPGRFHYHFRFEYPTQQEIREYMSDNLDERYHSEIPHVLAFSKKVRLNYDCLRAIALEINMGVSFGEAISDLNILNVEEYDYDVTLCFENGKRLYNKRYELDLYDEDDPFIWIPFYNQAGVELAQTKLNKSEIAYDPKSGLFVIKPNGFSLDFDEYDEDNKLVASYRKMKPSCITFSRSKEKNLHFSL